MTSITKMHGNMNINFNQLSKKYNEGHPENKDRWAVKKNAKNKINITYHYYRS